MQLSTRIHAITYSLYFPMSRVAPWLMEWGYDHSNRPFSTEPILPIWDRINAARLVRLVRELNPDIAVCTHFMPAGIVAHLIERRAIRSSLAIVTTDYDVHGVFLGRTFSRYFVALEEGRAYCRAIGIPEDRVTAAGIPVDPAFAAPFDRAEALAAHRLRADAPVVLVSAGAAGSTTARRVVEQLMGVRRDAQVVVVCGRNQALRRQVEALTARQAERFRVLGFTDRMPDLMRLATVFIGKPGGLTASECMAAGLPMLIVEPLPGQEGRNANHLLEAGAALRCHELAAVGYKVGLLLDQPQRLAQMRERARWFGRPRAAQAIAETVLADPLPPIQLTRAQRRRIVAAASGRPAGRS
jgi:processive 1,2-diacylglycerol beta-glucosyltransferase